MKANIMGIHKNKRKLSDGTVKTYHYAWRGGPRIHAEPNTRQFFVEYVEATHGRDGEKCTQTITHLVCMFKDSQDYKSLRTRTRKDYDGNLSRILDKFADLPISALDEKGIRTVIKAWHDSMAATPRTADQLKSAFVRLVSFAKDRELIEMHRLERMSNLYKGSRADIIWQPDQIETFMDGAPLPLKQAFMIGLWTGQRQGDILSLSWSNYDGDVISLKQSKSSKRVRIKVSPELKQMLDNMPRKAITILTNEHGLPWGSGFGGQFHKWRNKLNIKTVAYTDLRGTFVTLAKSKGYSVQEICQASGHSEKEAERILTDHYFAADLIDNVQDYKIGI